MYKDRDKQREAAKERAKRYRNAHRRVTPNAALGVTPCKAGGKRGVEIQCFSDLPPDVQADIERYSRVYEVDGVKYTREQDRQARIARAIRYQHLFPDGYHQRGSSYVDKTPLPLGQYIRVAKPGDADYDGVCVKVGDNWQVGANQVQT